MSIPTRVLAALLLCFLALGTVAVAQSQYLVLYPGSGNSSTVMYVFQPGLLPQVQTNTIPSGTFQILPVPDGSKYYLLSNGSGSPVSVLDSTFQNLKVLGGSIQLAASAGAITPDGRRLVVLAGRVFVLDTGSDTVIAPAGLAVTGTPIDVVVSSDATRAYVLSQGAIGAGGTILTAIDLTQPIPAIVGTPLALNGDNVSPATGLALSPSGFIYLSNNYRIFEINPYTLTPTVPDGIPIQAYPGKPFVTPDGKYVIAGNLRPNQGGTSLVQIDLTTKVPQYFTNINDVLTQFFSQGTDAAGNDRLYAYSSGRQVYDITLGAVPVVNLSTLNQAFPSFPTFNSVTFSGEVPPRLMWALSTVNAATFLYQLDIGTQQLQQVTAPTQAAGLSVAGVSVSPTSGAAKMIPFNNTAANLTIAAGKQSSLPITVRLQDSLGRGLYRGLINFTSTNPNVVIQYPSVTTGSGGYASTFVTAPATAGNFTVTATPVNAPTVPPIDFVFTVPGTGGGGGGPNLGGTYYVSGDGQVVLEYNLSKPMMVQVRDSNGKPISGATVNWSIVGGALGSISGGLAATSSTDSNGFSSILFVATAVQAGLSFGQTQIQASGPAGDKVNFWITTVLATIPNGGFASVLQIEEHDTSGNPVFPNNIRKISGVAGAVQKNGYFVVIGVGAGPQTGSPISNIGIRAQNYDSFAPPDGSPALTGPDPTSPSASCVGDPLSNPAGQLNCDLQFGPQLGSGPLYFFVGEAARSQVMLLTVLAGTPKNVTLLNGDGQSGKPGTKLPIPLMVKVTDAGGNPLGPCDNLHPACKVPIAWTVSGSATLSSTSTVTDANGLSSVNATLGSVPGPVKVTALITNADGTKAAATFNLTIAVTVATITVVSGDGQSTFTNGAFSNPLVVVVKDQQGNPVSNQQVNFTASQGGQLSASSVVTGSDGLASVRLTAGPSSGTITVIATAAGFQAFFNNLNVLVPGPQITTSSFLNYYSQQLGLTPCGLAAISGSNIAPGVTGTVYPPPFGPNPTTLGPVQSVLIGGYSAPITSISNIGGVERVNIQTPCEVPAGPTQVVMTVQGGTTTVNNVTVLQYQPGMYLVPDNSGLGVALRPDGSYISATNPAAAGETVRFFVTGLGQTTPPIGTNTAGVGGQKVNVELVGGFNGGGATISDAQYLTGQIGVYVVSMPIPANTPPGTYGAIVAVKPPVGDLIFGNSVNIPIR